MKSDFPDKLRKIRVLKNWSQEYVAEKINVSVSSYARYETGKVEIDFYSVEKLAKLYKLTIDELANYGDKDYQDKSKTYITKSCRDHFFATLREDVEINARYKLEVEAEMRKTEI